MASRRASQKETTERSTGEQAEQVLVNLKFYQDNQLILEKGSKLTWKKIKDEFAKDFQVDL